ncbi:IQ domain-containing protein E [Grammomys surdaster]|uniref:IQ domain-containing protein E n=1 Tax=Grammomys surdaster TaxID=491861 RepID=UPI00109F102E|nr:IQ domain-containing protein E [Grammomys surdaster]
MSLGTTDLASETGDDSLSAITFDSDFESKTKRKNFHKPPSTSPRSELILLRRPFSSSSSKDEDCFLPLAVTEGDSIYIRQQHLNRVGPQYLQGCLVLPSLHMQKSDVDLMRTKLRRLEEENSRKDRQIEQLLDPGRGPDFVRTLAEKKPDTGWVITGLKQRIFRLEQQCKEKDNTINKLQTDMKTTNLEEMRIAMETYYEEIHRLQTLLASSEATGKKPTVEKKLGVKRQKKMSSALLNLTRSVQELTEENQSLKEDLDRMLSNSPTVSKIKGYVDWSKPRLLRRIAELEKKVSSSESPKSASELGKPNPLVRSPSNISVQKQPKEDQSKEDQPKVDPSEDQEHLQGALKSLKEELSALQEQLLEKDLEMKQLLQCKVDLEKELETARESVKRRREQEQAWREEIETLTKKCQELEEARRQERDSFIAVTHEAHPEQHAPSTSSKHSEPDSDNSADEEGSSQTPALCSEERRESAVRTLQAQWKAHRHKKRKAALDEAATVLQAAFRGHRARSKLVRSKAPDCRSPSPLNQSSPIPRVPSPISPAEDNPAQEEAIIVIQSILRGYLAQARFIANCCREIAVSSQRGAVSVTPSESISPPSLAASPGKDSEASGGEAAEDEDEAEEPPDLQPYSGAVSVGLCAAEELRQTAASEPAPVVPDSPRGGRGDCPSSSSLEAVPSGKDTMCEDRSSSTGSAGPSLAELSPPRLQPLSPPPAEDICSDDSDDVIFSPFLPRKKSPSPF